MSDTIKSPFAKATAKSSKSKPSSAVQFGVPAQAELESPNAFSVDLAGADLLTADNAAVTIAEGISAEMPMAAPAPVAADTAISAELPVMAERTPTQIPIQPEGTTMNETIDQARETMTAATNDATAKAGAFFNDANGRAKDAMAKGTKAIEELVEFSKGNLEALTASGRVAAKGAEEIAKYTAEYGRATIEKANATARQFASVKSPAEFFQLQGEVAKATLDAVVAEGSKFTESYLKLIGEVTQPVSNRVAMAVDKVKTSTAA